VTVLVPSLSVQYQDGLLRVSFNSNSLFPNTDLCSSRAVIVADGSSRLAHAVCARE
jgi:hypothetical protein